MELGSSFDACDVISRDAQYHRRIFIVPAPLLANALRDLPIIFGQQPAQIIAYGANAPSPGYDRALTDQSGTTVYYPSAGDTPCIDVDPDTDAYRDLRFSMTLEMEEIKAAQLQLARQGLAPILALGAATIQSGQGPLIVACETGSVRSALTACAIYASALGYADRPAQRALIARRVDRMAMSNLGMPWNDNAGLFLGHGGRNGYLDHAPELFSSTLGDPFRIYLATMVLTGQAMEMFNVTLRHEAEWLRPPHNGWCSTDEGRVLLCGIANGPRRIFDLSALQSRIAAHVGASLGDIGITPRLNTHYGALRALLASTGPRITPRP